MLSRLQESLNLTLRSGSACKVAGGGGCRAHIQMNILYRKYFGSAPSNVCNNTRLEWARTLGICPARAAGFLLDASFEMLCFCSRERGPARLPCSWDRPPQATLHPLLCQQKLSAGNQVKSLKKGEGISSLIPLDKSLPNAWHDAIRSRHLANRIQSRHVPGSDLNAWICRTDLQTRGLNQWNQCGGST